MNKTETAALLAYAAARDNRKEDRAAVEAWFEDLGDLPFEDCKTAVRQHFQTSDDYLMPVHIRSIVQAIRGERVRAAGDLGDRIPVHIRQMEGTEGDMAEIAWKQEVARRIGDGELVDDIAPRLQLVRGGAEQIKAITERMAREKRAPGTRPRDESA